MYERIIEKMKAHHAEIQEGKEPLRWVKYRIRKMSLNSKVSRAEGSVIQFPTLL